MSKKSPEAVVVVEAKVDAPKLSHPAHSVFIEVKTTGKRGASCAVPLHEIPLLIRKTRASGEHVIILGTMRDKAAAIRGESMESLQDIFTRLNERYTYLPEGAKEGDTVNLVATMYGLEREGLKSLAITMRSLHTGFNELIKSNGKREVNEEDVLALLSAHGPERTLESELLSLA